MCVYVCLYICVYLYVYECVYVCMCVHTQIRLHTVRVSVCPRMRFESRASIVGLQPIRVRVCVYVYI